MMSRSNSASAPKDVEDQLAPRGGRVDLLGQSLEPNPPLVEFRKYSNQVLQGAAEPSMANSCSRTTTGLLPPVSSYAMIPADTAISRIPLPPTAIILRAFFRSPLDRAEPIAPNQPAPGPDHRPVAAELATRGGVGGVDAGFGR